MEYFKFTILGLIQTGVVGGTIWFLDWHEASWWYLVGLNFVYTMLAFPYSILEMKKQTDNREDTPLSALSHFLLCLVIYIFIAPCQIALSATIWFFFLPVGLTSAIIAYIAIYQFLLISTLTITHNVKKITKKQKEEDADKIKTVKNLWEV